MYDGYMPWNQRITLFGCAAVAAKEVAYEHKLETVEFGSRPDSRSIAEPKQTLEETVRKSQGLIPMDIGILD